jgi:hypothetical protein
LELRLVTLAALALAICRRDPGSGLVWRGHPGTSLPPSASEAGGEPISPAALAGARSGIRPCFIVLFPSWSAGRFIAPVGSARWSAFNQGHDHHRHDRLIASHHRPAATLTASGVSLVCSSAAVRPRPFN